MKIVYDLVWDADPLSDLRQRLSDISFVRTKTPEEMLAELPDAEVLILSGRRYTRELADAIRNGGAPKLRWVQTAAVGTDTLMRNGLREGVLVSNAAGLKGPTVAEHAISLLLGLCHCLPIMERNRQAVNWGDTEIRKRMTSLEEKTLVVGGYGSIGREIVRKAKAFDMHVIAVNRSGTGGPPADRVIPMSELNGALGEADAVVLALPITADTKGLFGARRLGLMKPGSYLVNVGRGEVVDEAALIEALKAGRIAGAGLDVFEREPLPADSPLWGMSNVIISPHVATVAGETFKRFAALVGENIDRFRAGRDLLNAVGNVPQEPARLS